MYQLEQFIIQLLLNFSSEDVLNAFLRDPQHTATIVGTLIAISGALLGTFLLLRGLSLTSDAISHTVLLGIVVAFLVMTSLFNLEPDLSSVWLIIGRGGALAWPTVVLTELLYRSGPGQAGRGAGAGLSAALCRGDHPGLALCGRCSPGHGRRDGGRDWRGLGQHQQPLPGTLRIGDDHARRPARGGDPPMHQLPRTGNQPARRAGRVPGALRQLRRLQSGSSLAGGPGAEPAAPGLLAQIDHGDGRDGAADPALCPRSFYKELKLSTFDAALAAALGFRPVALNYALMVMVSLVAVGAL